MINNYKIGTFKTDTYKSGATGDFLVTQRGENGESGSRSGGGLEPACSHIERLCVDFGLEVLRGSATNKAAFSLAVKCGENFQRLTPHFPSMPQLETFVADNMVDILHNYLCSETVPS